MFNYNPNQLSHSKAPWFHSWNNPTIRIAIKNKVIIIVKIKLFVFSTKGIGRIKVISTSKIKKIKEIR